MPVDDLWLGKKRGPDGKRLPTKRHGVEIDAYYVELAKKRETERKLAAPSNQFTTKGSATVADLPQSAPKSRDKAARAVGASGRGVQQAKAVMRSAPDLADQVRAGNLALDNAYRQARARERAMPRRCPPRRWATGSSA